MIENSFNEDLNIMTKYNINPNELFFIKTLRLAQEGDSSYIIKYMNNINGSSDDCINILKSLQEKSVILKSFKLPKKGDSLDFGDIPFNKNFLKSIITLSNVAGKELFDKYPKFIQIKGTIFSLRNIGKFGLHSLEDFCLFYNKTIKSSAITHEKIMELLSFAVENDLINYGICEFISSHKWEEIEEVQNGNIEINGCYNNTELL